MDPKEETSNKAALEGLFRWMEALIKEDFSSIVVFLVSSDQFFFNWIQSKLENKIKIIQVIDLPKIEAENYFLFYCQSINIMPNNLPFTFNELYQLTGSLQKLISPIKF